MVHLLLAVIYISFVSLGLPDALLGAAWPMAYPQLGVPVSYVGIVSMIICACTVVSSLQSNRMTRKLGTGRVTAISVAMTAVALFGFSTSSSFVALCLWAIPYGLGAGSVDAALNNYVSLHYKSRHMSWLHCMWGLGASIGPSAVGFVLTGGQSWTVAYRMVAMLQIVLTAILIFSIPLWKRSGMQALAGDGGEKKVLTLPQILAIPGAREVMLAFFCYCALEQTTALWTSSYLVLHKGISPEIAANFASLAFIGIAVGRAVSGVLTIKLTGAQMVRLGQGIVGLGALILLLPLGQTAAMVGLVLVGLGCAPIYPCIIYATPERFGADRSQALLGVQMASAYTGSCLMPSFFGVIAEHIDVALMPVYLLVLLTVMVVMHETLLKKTQR